MPSEKTILSLLSDARKLGDFGIAAREEIANLEFSMEKASIYRKMSPEELFAEVNSLKDGMPGLGGAGVDTLLEAETLQVANVYLNAANANVKKMAAIEKAEAQPIIDNLNAQIESFQALTDDGFEVPLEDFEALAASIKELPDALTQDLKTDFELLALDSSFVNQLREATLVKFLNILAQLNRVALKLMSYEI